MHQVTFATSLILLFTLGPGAQAQGDKDKVKTFPPLRLLYPAKSPEWQGKMPDTVKDDLLPLTFGPTLRKMFNDPFVVDVAGIVVFPAPEDKANGAAVVICPGGGYGHLAA